MREVLLLLAIGLVLGVPSGMALGKYVASTLYCIQPRDPWIAGATIVRVEPLLASSCRAHSGVSREPHRSDPGAALRMTILGGSITSA